MTLLSNAHFEYLVTILDDLKQKNVRFKLVGGEFRIDINAPNATPELVKWIGHHREGLTLALARQQKLCLVCRRERAKRPYDSRPHGYRDWCEECWRKQIAWFTEPQNAPMGATKAEKQKEAEEPCLLLI